MFLFKYFSFLLILFSFFIACNLKKPIKKVKKAKDFPSRTIYNAEINIKEIGEETILAKGKVIEEYGFSDIVYTSFPKGIELTFFEKGKKNPGKLFANQAKVIPVKQWYEAKGNVLIISPEGDTIKSSIIYWDRDKKIIFSPSKTIISKFDNSIIYANDGIEASEDLKNYTLRNDNGLAYPD